MFSIPFKNLSRSCDCRKNELDTRLSMALPLFSTFLPRYVNDESFVMDQPKKETVVPVKLNIPWSLKLQL